MNVWDVVLILCIVTAVALAVRGMRRRKHCGGCGCCPYADDCDKK